MPLDADSAGFLIHKQWRDPNEFAKQLYDIVVSPPGRLATSRPDPGPAASKPIRTAPLPPTPTPRRLPVPSPTPALPARSGRPQPPASEPREPSPALSRRPSGATPAGATPRPRRPARRRSSQASPSVPQRRRRKVIGPSILARRAVTPPRRLRPLDDVAVAPRRPTARPAPRPVRRGASLAPRNRRPAPTLAPRPAPTTPTSSPTTTLAPPPPTGPAAAAPQTKGGQVQAAQFTPIPRETAYRFFFGTVTAKIGLGSDGLQQYTCDLRPSPNAAVEASVTVEMWVLDPNDTLPNGSPLWPVMYCPIDGIFYCQPPVWF